jgi:hypothetical protein
VTLTTQSLSGDDTWRVMAAKVTDFPVSDGNGGVKAETVNVVLAVDLGDIGALTTRLEVFDLIVGGVIVVVLAAVGRGGRPAQPAAAQRHRADRRTDRGRAPGAPGARRRPAHRNRLARPVAERDARAD